MVMPARVSRHAFGHVLFGAKRRLHGPSARLVGEELSRVAALEDGRRKQKRVDAENGVVRAGWYGVDGLDDDAVFQRWKQSVVGECLALRHFIVSSRFSKEADDLHPRLLVQALDSISARLCLLLDTGEICTSSHADSNARNAASESYGALSAFVNQINMDRTLYQPLADMLRDSNSRTELSNEEFRVADALKKEFERDGIHLCQDEKELVGTLHEGARTAESAFVQLANDPTFLPELELSFKESCQLALDRYLNAVVSQYGRLDTTATPPSYRLRLEPKCLSSILQHCGDSSLRRRVFETAYDLETARRNIDALRSLIDSRRSLANALGFPSFASFSIHFRMATSPHEVESFLDQLADRIRPAALKEQHALERKMEESLGVKAPLLAWDFDFWVNKSRNEKYGEHLGNLNEYFSVDNCIAGIKLVCKRIFGLELKQVELGPNESWAPDLQKIEIREERNGALAGTLYLDLFHRVGKYNKPAHYVVQCSHTSRSLSNFFQPAADGGASRSNSTPPEDYYQLPCSVLLCGFDRNNPKLGFSQVLTLWHEFGHALHAICSRTEFQHLSGTRGEQDFVETPSQLFEYFCADARVLQEWAFDEQGRQIPLEVCQALANSRSAFNAMELQQQLFFAGVDLKLFSTTARLSDNQSLEDMAKELQEKYTGIPHVPHTFPLARFSHFAHYGSTYYSYVFARVFAADIWRTCFLKDPLSREAGTKLRTCLFEPGGSKTPDEMLRSLLGRPASMDALVEEITEGEGPQ